MTRARAVVNITSGLVGFIAVLVLSGWLLNLRLLKSVFPSLTTMKANTAICLAFLALAVWMGRTELFRQRRRVWILLLTGLVALIAAVTLSEYAFHWNAGIDELLFRDFEHLHTAFPPGRFAPATGACLLLFCGALLVLDKWPRISHGLTLAAAFVVLVALIGYLYNLPALYGSSRYTSLALHTTISLLLLCGALLASRPGRGLVGLQTGSRREGSSVYLLIAGAWLLPIGLGSAALWGQQRGWYGSDFTLAFFSVSLIVLATALVWLTGVEREKIHLRRVKAESALRASEERLRLALQSGAIGTWDYDAHTQERNWDARCRAIFGFPADMRLDAASILACVHPEDRELVRRSIAEYVNPKGTGRLEMEHRALSWSDGSMRYVYAQGVTTFVGEGNNRRAVRSIGILQDITLIKEREHALLHLNDELEQFAYAAAHDLQEPLRNVSLSTQLVARRYGHVFDHKAQDLVKTAIKGSLQMEAMVRDLLAYSRALNTEGEESAPADSNVVLSMALENLSAAIAETQAQISCQPLPKVRMRAVHLLQVFQNLIGNSLKYSGDKQPRIEISSLSRDGVNAFYVKDNGVGIPAAYHERAFGVFKRLHSQDIAGTGIGLALCKRLVEHYGGRIWIESEAGQGATVLFTLQLAEGRKRPTG